MIERKTENRKFEDELVRYLLLNDISHQDTGEFERQLKTVDSTYCAPPMPPKVKRRAYRALQKNRRKQNRIAHPRRRIAIGIAIAVALALPVTAVAFHIEDVANFFLTWFEDHGSLGNGSNPEDSAATADWQGRYRPPYLPDQLTLVSFEVAGDITIATYTSQGGGQLVFKQTYASSGVRFHADGVIQGELYVDGEKGAWAETEDRKVVIIWGSETQFPLVGDDKAELLKTAESLEFVPSIQDKK